MFSTKDKIRKDITVKDLIEFLKDCRPDAEVYASYYCGTDELRRVKDLKNGGNYVQIVY